MTKRSPSRPALAALAALLVIAAWPAGTARADDDSNIPGVPLPGPLVTGQLGGPIYDHVYSIDVAAESVIQLSLSGDPGTDFDLYLFNASATSVYETPGQVAQSTGPTSTESISYPSPAGGRFYIDLNGASDVEGNFRLVVSIARDTVPPNVELKINDGAPLTKDQTVQVTVVATDNLSGVDAVQFSVDGTTYDAWRQYTPSVLWTFPVGDGAKQLWARVRDQSGNVSAVATATIVLDTVPPRVVTRDPGPNEFAIGLRPTFVIQFDEPIRQSTWVDHGLIVQRSDGTTVAGTYAWHDGTNTGTFVPDDPEVPGETLVLSLGSVTDVAGNPVGLYGNWVVHVLLQHTIDLTVTPSVVVTGGQATLLGQIDAPVSAPVTLETSVPGGPWVTVGPLFPSLSGAVGQVVRVDSTSAYRIHVGSSPTEASVDSAPVRVVARRSVGLVGVSSSTTRTVKAGRTVALVAQVGPASPDVIVALTAYRYDAARRAYVASATFRRTSANGRVAFSWRPTATGSYYLRLTTPPSVPFANGTSAIYRFKVT